MKMPQRVLIVGMGGLGCPSSWALARAGVKHLTLVDADFVEVSNLHRQLWHTHADLGRAKVESAYEKLRAEFPRLGIECLQGKVDDSNVEALFLSHDLVIDGVDGLATKLFLSDAAVVTQKPLVYAGVIQMRGQAMRIRPGGPCLRCLFGEDPSLEEAPTCSGAGVLGSMAGILGGLQALLALAPWEAEGQAALQIFDGLTLRGKTIQVTKNTECSACGAFRRPWLEQGRHEA